MIADALVDDVVADATDTTDDNATDATTDTAEEDTTDEEVLMADQTTSETSTIDNDDTAETVAETAATIQTIENQVNYRELTDEEKAALLADAIAKSTLESALAIADSPSLSNSAATLSTDSNAVSKNTAQTNTLADADLPTTDARVEESNTQVTEDNAAADLLDTGRQMGRDALAFTQASSDQSAADSASAVDGTVMGTVESVASIDLVSQRQDAYVMITESDATTGATDTMLTMQQDTELTSLSPADTGVIEQADTFKEIMDIEFGFDNADIANVLSQIQNNTITNTGTGMDTTSSGLDLGEQEQVTIANDPALALAFNVLPNVANLEASGALSAPKPELSDAERRAEEVVAANAREQEEINNNYMEADQSGIVAAMGSDTDVASYRSAMLRDNNNWYRPEDIYRNILYRDNVRGAYYLEKSNTDTYRRMVDEQYK